jgi:hypothetical protein
MPTSSPPTPVAPSDVELPVYLYDVTTTDVEPRLVVSCRTPDAAQFLATRLNQLQAEGVLADPATFTAAEPRLALVRLPITPGGTVTIQGYAVATEEVANALNAAKAAAANVPASPMTAPGGAAQ